jgi:hypothetical protein
MTRQALCISGFAALLVAAGCSGGSSGSGAAGSATDGASNSPSSSGSGSGGSSSAEASCTAQSFDDDFSDGLRTNDWTILQTTSGFYEVNTSGGDIQLTKVETNPGDFEAVGVQWNMASAVGGPVAGDFECSVDFSQAALPGSGDQTSLEIYFDDGSLFEVGANGNTIGTWSGTPPSPCNVLTYCVGGTTAANGSVAAQTGGTLRITRVGSTVSGYLDDTLVYARSFTSGPVTGVGFVLQQDSFTNDAISVQYDNFHFQGCAGPNSRSDASPE